jgi:hypothetical protein
MAHVVNTPDGYMNMDEQDDLEAADLLSQMIGLMRLEIAAGGFTEEDVLFLIRNWEKVGELLRSSTYHQNIRGVWLMSAPDNTTGKKTSKALLDQIQDLLRHAGDADAQMHSIVFNDTQDMMRTFVYEFRQALKRRDADRAKLFDSKLQHQITMRRLP